MKQSDGAEFSRKKNLDHSKFFKNMVKDEVFEKLANKRLILRRMMQYKIPNSLRLTIGKKQANEHFIQAIGSIIK